MKNAGLTLEVTRQHVLDAVSLNASGLHDETASPPRHTPQRQRAADAIAAMLADAARGADRYVKEYVAGRGAE